MLRSMRDEWCKALRSGDYSQGKYHLNCDGRYCCLGVLCELNLDKVNKTQVKSALYTIFEYNKSSAFLPTVLSSKKNPKGPLDCSDWEISLMKMNDNDIPFSQIADWIEENVPVEEDETRPSPLETGVFNHG